MELKQLKAEFQLATINYDADKSELNKQKLEKAAKDYNDAKEGKSAASEDPKAALKAEKAAKLAAEKQAKQEEKAAKEAALDQSVTQTVQIPATELPGGGSKTETSEDTEAKKN